MKPKNNTPNRRQFFALYYGQRVARRVIHHGTHKEYIYDEINDCVLDYPSDYTLELKVYYTLTQEEREYFDELMLGNAKSNLNAWGVDYLRTIGVALPWNGLTIEDLIFYGWVDIENEV